MTAIVNYFMRKDMLNIFSQHSCRYSFFRKYWPKSGAIFELAAFLFESLTRDPIWRKKVLMMSDKKIEKIVYFTTLSDLYLLKRYLGKFFMNIKLIKVV